MKTKEYWHLRSGDFRPELLGSDNAGYANRHIALEQLAATGNLFYDEASATEASQRVRNLLKSGCLRQAQEYSPQNERHSDSNPQHSPTSSHETPTEGNPVHSGGLQLPMPQTASHQQDDNSQANAVEIHIEVRIHS